MHPSVHLGCGARYDWALTSFTIRGIDTGTEKMSVPTRVHFDDWATPIPIYEEADELQFSAAVEVTESQKCLK